MVHVQGIEGERGDVYVDGAGAFYLGEVAGTAEQVVGDPGGAPAPAGDLKGSVLVDWRTENIG